ncbi:nucleotide disphospho-sugar-binding domain-containing protein [Streptomyces albireticuli]|uniref:nucleotide disphospho-sugar-binding domain-containing protein n=1 Tax=Streptomyces albireticuli TaxID=1940 RepID=UPI0036999D3F
MRIMFTVLPVTSHVMIMAPLAAALQSAGHEVRVVTHDHPGTVAAITGAGLAAVPLGAPIDLAGAVRDTFANETLEGIARTTGVDPSDANLWPMIRHYLVASYAMYYPAEPTGPADATGPAAPGAAGIADEMVEFAREWRPDLVLWDPLFFPSPIAARACGAAHARLLWGLDRFGWLRAEYLKGRTAAGGTEPDLMAGMMRPLLDRFGVAFDEDLLVGQWSVNPWPEPMRLPLDLDYLSVRPVPFNGVVALPEWLRRTPEKPRVCFTLGTSGRDLFAENGVSVPDVFAAVADLDIELVATLNEAQLAGVDSVPDNVRVTPYVPMSLLLPTCSAIIHIGGAGSWSAAGAHAVPQLLVPKSGSEYLDFARYAAGKGAGIVIEDARPTVATLREALLRLLHEPSFQEGTAALREDLGRLPSPVEIVPELEARTLRHRSR